MWIQYNQEKERVNFLKILGGSFQMLDFCTKAGGTKRLIVDIPENLKQQIQSGNARFMKSGKIPGNLTPNIRIEGEKGIAGQVTLRSGWDPVALTSCLSNMMMNAMLVQISSQIDDVKAGVVDIKAGMMNDRISTVLGAYKNYVQNIDRTKTESGIESLRNQVLGEMNKGLTQIHFEIDRLSKEIMKMPKNWLEFFWKELWTGSIFANKDICLCNEFLLGFEMYHKLILLQDVILYHSGGSVDEIFDNHKELNNLSQRLLNNKFVHCIEFTKEEKVPLLLTFPRVIQNPLSLLEKSSGELMLEFDPNEID